MKQRMAFFVNDFFILDGDKIIGVECCARRAMLGDRVRLKSDTPEYGKIIDFADDNSGKYFCVQLESGKYAYMDRTEISEVFPCSQA